MAKLLIELPHNASTDKYDKYFPYPLHLIKLLSAGDKLIDLNLQCFNKINEEKYNIIDNCLNYIHQNHNDFSEIIICAGSYIPDADKKTFYHYFLDNINIKKFTLTGPYSDIYYKEIEEKYSHLKIIRLKTDYDFSDFKIPLDMLDYYPKVGNKLKVNMRISQGCPRMCAMCPCPIIYNGKYKFYDINKTLETIKYYYENNVRFFNLIDDNLSCTPKFINFLKELKELKLKKTQFMCQEGFEVTAFHNEEFCQLIKDNNFIDIKLGIENVKEDFLTKINKYYNKFEDIEKAINNIKKYNLDVKIYLLIGLDETIEDIEDNLKFIAKSGVSVRCNILRPYEGSELYKTQFEQKINSTELKHIKSFIHALSWLNETYAINFYDENALSLLKEKIGFKIKKDSDKIIITGKIYFGFKTSKFILIIQNLLEKHFNIKLKNIEKNKENIIFQKIKVKNERSIKLLG